LTIAGLITSSELTLNFDVTTPGGSGDLLTVTNSLVVRPGTPVTLGTIPTLIGDYRLIAIPRGFDLSMVSNFDLHATGAKRSCSLSAAVDPGYIDLVVPEPSALVLLAVGAVGLFGWAWRRRKLSGK
jgi:hypothetical protein